MACLINLLLQKPYSAIDRMDRMDLIGKGRPTPDLRDLKVVFDGKTLQFDRTLYTRHDWLCGSEVLQGVYCWPCILFAQDRISYWTKIGFRDLTGLAKAAASHEDSIGHIRSKYQYTFFINNNMRTAPMEKVKTAPNPTIAKNHKFLKTVINAIHYLAESNSLREENGRQYVSLTNFLRLLKRDCTDDELIIQFLQREGTDAQAESLQFLCDVIESISKALQECIKNEVKDVNFVTLVIDESLNTPRQLSIGLRYINAENKLVERMLGFLDTINCDMAAGIQEYLIDAEVGEKLIAQAWGATTCDLTTLDETQRAIKSMTSATLFLPYDVAEIIQTLSQATFEIPAIHSFFASLNRITAIFNETEKLAACMDLVFEDLSPKTGDPSNFISYMLELSKNPVYVIEENKRAIVGRFKQLIEHGSVDMEGQLLGACTQACVYLEDPRVTTLLSIFEKIFVIVHKMINWISEASSDGFACVKLNEIVRKAIADISDLAQTEWTEEALTTSTFLDVNKAVSIITGSLAMRMEELEKLKFFRLFGTKNYRVYLKTFPDDLMTNLMSAFERHFNRIRLRNELLVLYGTPEFVDKSPPFLFHYFQEEKSLGAIFPQTLKLLQLMITLPSHFIPVANTRLSHRIANHTRKFVGQPRVTELAVIDANLDLFTQVKDTPEFFNAFIDDLANKQREMELRHSDEQGDSEMEVVVSIRQGLR